MIEIGAVIQVFVGGNSFKFRDVFVRLEFKFAGVIIVVADGEIAAFDEASKLARTAFYFIAAPPRFVKLEINFVMAHFKYRSKKVEAFIEGVPRILIENGEINREAIARELLTEEDLDVMAHKQGFETVAEMKKCILDANGNFLFLGKKNDRNDQYKKNVLDKINKLTVHLIDLQNSLQKS